MNQYQHRSKQELIRELEQLKTRLQHGPTSNSYSIEEKDLLPYLPAEGGDEVFLLTETGRIVFANDIMLDSLGLSRENVFGRSLADFDQNFRRSSWLSSVSAMKRSGESLMFESKQRTASGPIRTLEIAATFILHKGKNFVLCVGNELESAESEENDATDDMPTAVTGPSREHAILSIVSDGILVVDAKGTIVDANPAGCRILGVPKSEIIGRSCVDPKWRYVDTHGNIMKISEHPIMVSLVEEEPVLNIRVNMMQTEGGMFPFLLSVNPLFDTFRNVTGAVASFRAPQAQSPREPDKRGATTKTQRDELLAILIGSDSINELERRICEYILALGPYSLAWTGTIKSRDPKIHVSTSAGESKDYLLKIRMRYDDSEHGRGPAGECIRTRSIQIVHDIGEDDRYAIWQKQAVKMKLFSSAYFPIPLPGDRIMLLCVYARERDHFTVDVVSQLKAVADVFAHGMATLTHRAEYDSLHEEHVMHTQLLESLRTDTRTAVAMFDAESPHFVRFANSAFCRLLDEPFRSGGVQERAVMDFGYCHQQHDLAERVAQCAREGEALDSDEEVFRDWTGQESVWKWHLRPCTLGDTVQRVLYLADQMEPSASEQTPGAQPVITHASPLPQASKKESAPGDDSTEARIGITMPRPKPRSRKQTRVAQFFTHGEIFHCDTAAQSFLGVPDTADGATLTPSQLFADGSAIRSGIEEALTGDAGIASFRLASGDATTGAQRSCEVRVEHPDADTSRVWVVFR
jgi:PAS domain S-box-containing protein